MSVNAGRSFELGETDETCLYPLPLQQVLPSLMRAAQAVRFCLCGALSAPPCPSRRDAGLVIAGFVIPVGWLDALTTQEWGIEVGSWMVSIEYAMHNYKALQEV